MKCVYVILRLFYIFWFPKSENPSVFQIGKLLFFIAMHRCRDPEYMCRIVTLIHATTITLGSFWVTFMSGFNPYLVLGMF